MDKMTFRRMRITRNEKLIKKVCKEYSVKAGPYLKLSRKKIEGVANNIHALHTENPHCNMHFPNGDTLDVYGVPVELIELCKITDPLEGLLKEIGKIELTDKAKGFIKLLEDDLKAIK